MSLANHALESRAEEDTVINTREESMKALRAVPVVARTLVQGLEDTALRARPAQGEWAAVEVIAHMADTDERALERIRRMRHEDEPSLAAFDPEALAVERAYIAAPIEPTLRRLGDTIAALVTELSALDNAGWERVGQHEAHGRISIAQYVAHVAAEDVDHLAQLARLHSA
jgi:DinB family protein